jgi:hypothetical protein
MLEKNTQLDINNATDGSINIFIKKFISDNLNIINKFGQKAFGSNNKLSLFAFQELAEQELKKACYSFINNNHNIDYLNSYLFASISKIYKNITNENKKNVYICPGCKSFNIIEVLNYSSKDLFCNRCRNTDNNYIWEKLITKTFSSHTRRGYKCPDCENFIPHNNITHIICPYPDCFFVGEFKDVRLMKHPFIKSTLEIPSKYEFGDTGNSTEANSLLNNEFDNYIKIINECINTQISVLHFKCNNSTYINKLSMYEAYSNLLLKYPSDMISYLVFLNRNINVQHKIFQEFTRILESKIPFTYNKNGKIYEIKSLLDDNLALFNSYTEYNSYIDQYKEIPNSINELYVGGRKGRYCRSYYIGKLIDVIDINNNQSLLNNVKEYNFVKIMMDQNVMPNTPVNVKLISHAPHYQMGGMVYLNRIRRELVDKIYFIINGKKRKIQRPK